MKAKKLLFLLPLLFVSVSFSQAIIEKTHELSKNATKGYFYDAVQNPENGHIEVTYKFKKGSKDADATYETYFFDKDLTFIKNEEIKWTENDKAPYTKTYVYATVGGCSSFSILGMNLNLSKETWNYTWNGDKKRFDGKRTENVAINLENAEKRAYSGYAAYRENATGKMMVLASTETKGSDGKIKKDFILLEVKTDLSTKEIELPLGASQLVYCDVANSGNAVADDDESGEGTLDNGDMIFIFAPTFNKNASVDYKQYTYLRIDKNGVIRENLKIDMPSPNLVVTGLEQANDGSVFICGSYSKEEKTFDQLFKEYAPIVNPCYTGGTNYRMDTYEAKTEKVPMDFFTILKIKEGKVDWIKNTAVEDMARLLKTPEKQKGAPAYTGKRFRIEYFNVTGNGDIFISGQLLGRVKIGDGMVTAYKEIICFQISSTGDVKAQYGIKTESVEDKLNTIFPIVQEFMGSADGSVIYWNLLEVKTLKGYAGFSDAYNGSPTFYANYNPSMVKINTVTNKIEDYKTIGDKKFMLNKTVPYIYNKAEKSVIYIGSDKDKTLWLAKYTMN